MWAVLLRNGLTLLLALAALLVAPSAGVTGLSATAEAASAADAVRLTPNYARIAGTTIAWAELGEGRPLLLLNGTGSPMSQWDPKWLAALADQRRVIVFDYPGLGVSGAAPKRITFPRLANWTAQLLRQLGLSRVDVFGWSMGGFVAQNLVRRHPELVGRLILAGTNPGSAKTKLGPRWAQRIDSDPDAGLRGYLRTNYPLRVAAQRAGRRAVARINDAITSGRYPPDTVPARTYNQMVEAEDPWLRSSRNCRQLARVEQRTLVITGRKDVVTPPANSRLLTTRLPKAQLRLLADTGHSFLFQKPDKVAGIVSRFLQSG
ncbi:MAG: alpha/beta hydrolase [Actinobacteria bacterium]|nr:alpha/beta hydrolase [Actinomycetota bacterium]